MARWRMGPTPEAAGLMFSAGKKVEVSFEKEDYRDVWFPATVLEDSGNGSFLVEYQCTGISDEAGFHKVTVDYLHIRPSPPHLRDKSFVLLEKVDAFYDFGWWSGVITKELADSRYIVFFKHTNKERELSHSSIRPHMECRDGKWFSASQSQDVVCNNPSGTETAVSRGDSGTMKGSPEEGTPCVLNEQTTLCIEKQSNVVTSVKKKTKHTNLDIDDTHSQPSKKLKEGKVAEALCELNTSSSVALTEVTVVGFNSSTTEPMLGDQPSGKPESLSHGKKARSKRGKYGQLNSQKVGSGGKKGRPAKAQMKTSKASVLGGIGNSAGKTADDHIGKESVAKDMNIPIVIALGSNGRKSSGAKKPSHLPDEKSLKPTQGQTQELGVLMTPVPVSNMGNGLLAGGESTRKRKRGRPPKLQAKRSENSAIVNQQNGDVAADEKVVKIPTGAAETESLGEEYPAPNKQLLYSTPKQNYLTSRTLKLRLAKKEKVLKGKSVPASSEQPMKQSSVKGKRGRRRTISVNNESSVPDSQDASKEKVDEGLEKEIITKEIESTVDKLPSTVSDDQPLSRWIEGMHPSTTVDSSGVAVVRTAEQCSEAGERQKEVTLQSLGVDCRDIVQADIQSLPFVKNTPLWETIQSMEVFQKIPQMPHFRPLDCFKESSREGLAIGIMVNFSSVVEKTSGLQFDNPKSVIEDCLETLVELEIHGFDVKVVRDRLNGLLLIKDKQEELQNRSKGLASRIEERNREKCKIDGEIDGIDKQIKKLQEKRALAVSEKESQNSEIAVLESSVDGVNESIRTTRVEFDGLVAAPW